MPFDMNGLPIHVGDSVLVKATIKEIHNTEDYCDVTLVSQEHKPTDNASPWVLGSKQVTLAKSQAKARSSEELTNVP